MKARYAILTLGFLISACGNDSGGEAPTGQVVATVDGQEITASELKLELGNAPSEGAAGAAAQQAALKNLVARRLLVAAAKERKLDTTPLAAMLKKRAEDAALVQLLQQSIAANVPKVSDEEVSDFIAAHPATFAQRKLISVDQLIVPQIDPKLVKQMAPLNTLAEVEALLNTAKVKFVRSASVLDSLNINPEMGDKITKLNTGEVFITPAGSGAQVAQIVASRTEPLAGAEAQQVARALLTRQRTSSQVNEAMQQIVKDGQAKVKVNSSYEAKPNAKPAPKN